MTAPLNLHVTIFEMLPITLLNSWLFVIIGKNWFGYWIVVSFVWGKKINIKKNPKMKKVGSMAGNRFMVITYALLFPSKQPD